MTLLRHIVGLLFLIIGSFFFVISAIAGYGLHAVPDPTMGLVIATTGAIGLFAGRVSLGTLPQSRAATRLISALFICGSINLLSAFGTLYYERLRHVEASEAGHSRPGSVRFGLLYGALSIVCWLVVHFAFGRRSAVSVNVSS